MRLLSRLSVVPAFVMFLCIAGTGAASIPAPAVDNGHMQYISARIGADVRFVEIYLVSLLNSRFWTEKEQGVPAAYEILVDGREEITLVY